MPKSGMGRRSLLSALVAGCLALLLSRLTPGRFLVSAVADNGDAIMLRTAAALELAASQGYEKLSALQLAGSNEFVDRLLDSASSAHASHAARFNSVLNGLGSSPQRAPDGKLSGDPRWTNSKTWADALAALIDAEIVTAATEADYAARANSDAASQALALAVPVTAQYLAVLRMLSTANTEGSLSAAGMPPDLVKLPAGAVVGAVGGAFLSLRGSRG